MVKSFHRSLKREFGLKHGKASLKELKKHVPQEIIQIIDDANLRVEKSNHRADPRYLKKREVDMPLIFDHLLNYRDLISKDKTHLKNTFYSPVKIKGYDAQDDIIKRC